MKTFKIEYEIPPLRAIYWAECDASDEQAVRDMVKASQPRWVIQKIFDDDVPATLTIQLPRKGEK